MQYKSRDIIPVWGIVLACIASVIAIGVLPTIPVYFYIRFNNRYARAYKNNDTQELELCEKKLKLCRNLAVVLTVISMLITAFITTQFVLDVLREVQNRLNCSSCG